VSLVVAAVLLGKRRPLGAAGLALASLLVILHAARAHDAAVGSPRALVQTLREQRRPGEPVVEYDTLSTGLDFYLGENHHHIDVLPRAFADGWPEGRGFEAPEWLLPRLASLQRVWMIGPEAKVTRLARTLPARATVVARGRDESLVLLEGDPGTSPSLH
jgi:hypothetical protein